MSTATPTTVRSRRVRRLLRLLGVVTASMLVAAGCGSGDDSGSKGGSKASGGDAKLVVYSGREEELVAPLYRQFEQQSGIDLDVRYGESPALAAQLAEEGDASPADVFFAQDAGAIGSVDDLLAKLDAKTLDLVDPAFRDGDGRWIGVTGRVRTLAYNTDELQEADLPASVLDLTDERWKGKIGVAPTNSSFQAFVTGMRIARGDDETLAFLAALKDNDARTYEKNSAIVEAVASGEVTVGLVNHYYVYELRGENPDTPVANHFFEDGDPGNLVNASAIGVLKRAEHPDAARQLVAFLLSTGQDFIVNDAPEREYPLVVSEDIAGNARYKELPPLDSIEGPDVVLGDLGGELEATVALIRESGLAG